MAEVPQPISPFDEWGRLTRFLESARLAFARERNMWASLGIDEPEHVRISAPADEGRYKVALKQHIDAVNDAETLHGSVLVHAMPWLSPQRRSGSQWMLARLAGSRIGVLVC